MSGIFHKTYPESVLEVLELFLPKRWQDDFNLIGVAVDWRGINYYTRSNVSHSDGPCPNLKKYEGPLDKSQMDREIYPHGLFDFIMRTHKDYTHGLPIYVTENGMTSDDLVENGMVNDYACIEYISAHLFPVLKAIKQGVLLAGYYVWSLLDNYEWALGYEKRFGLIHVDFKTQKRTPKKSYFAFKKALT